VTNSDTTLETSRLVLRPPRLDDAPSYALGIGEYAVARWLTAVPWPYTLAMARDWLSRSATRRPHEAIFIVELPGRGVIGSVSLVKELGFWIARPYWGRGFGTEAAEALIAWHFSTTDADGIGSSAHADNHVSLRVQEKLGFTPIGRELRFARSAQRDVEHVVTRLTRADWGARP